MKKIYILFLLYIALGTDNLMAQQQFQFTQYFQTPFAINQSFTGVNDYLDVKAGYRSQWTNFEYAPSSFFVGANGVIKSGAKGKSEEGDNYKRYKHGIGGFISQNVKGPYRQTAGVLSYASHVRISAKTFIALGVSSELANNTMAGDNFTVRDANDNTYISLINDRSETFLNMNAGMSIYSDKYYLGASAAQLVHNRLSAKNDAYHDKQYINYAFCGGYTFYVSPDFEIVPSVLVSYFKPLPTTAMINTKVWYKKFIWSGLSYKTNNSMGVLFGVVTKQRLNISYSYDYHFGTISNYNAGSHELVLGLMLGKKNQNESLIF